MELVKASVAEGDFEGLDYLKEVLGDLEVAGEKLDEILTAISKLEDFSVPLPIQDEISEIVVQVKEQTEETKAAVEAVSQAISNGMGAIFPLVEQLQGLLNDLKEVEQMLGNVEEQIAVVGENMVGIVLTIKQLNPNAKIYVMGYYNALPYLPDDTQAVTVPLIQGLNGAIEMAAETTGAIFVPTFDVFVGHYEAYLPNPEDIHQ